MAQPVPKKKAPARKPATKKKPAASPRSKAPVSPQVVHTEEELIRRRQIVGILVIALSLLLLVNLLLSPDPATADVSRIGVVSLYINKLLRYCVGAGAVVLPLFLLGYGVLFCASKSARGQRPRNSGLLLIFFSFLGFLQLSEALEDLTFKAYLSAAVLGKGGGLLGGILDYCLLKTVGKTGAIILFCTLILIGLLLFLQTSLTGIGRLVKRGSVKAKEALRSPELLDDEGEDQRPAPLVEPEQMVIANYPPPQRGPVLDVTPAADGNLPWSPAPSPLLQPAAAASSPALSPVLETALVPTAPSVPTPPPSPVKKPAKEPAFVRQFMPSISAAPNVAMESFFQPEVLPVSAAESPFAPEPKAELKQKAEPKQKDEPEERLKPISFIPPLMDEEEDFPEEQESVSTAEPAAVEEEAAKPAPTRASVAPASTATASTTPAAGRPGSTERKPSVPTPTGNGYVLPTPDLVEMGVRVKNPRLNKAITDGVGILESTLDSFGVKATVTQVVAGPAVTRYELQPAPGVKVSRITSLSDDIALSLAAQSVRIEAPIPGKSAIGIEVSRKEVDIVYFREMIDSEAFRNSKAKLSFVLGKNIGGENMVGNLSKMPHLLIAGATGSGKSICVNNIICSLLYKATPDEVKIMLIDPKKVEMMQYAHLPHLIAPVVNDSKKAANALKWVVNEMEARYNLFVAASVKDFDGYNQSHQADPLPHVVVIIDELADLMMVARHDVEESICRLAQMARAAGIHLVVATQRPSVDVITGLIKANIPSRIAFAVSSYTDSRTILDMGGAEKLLGRGDMLYAPVGSSKPMRIQGSYIDPADVNRLVDYCAAQARPSFSQAAVAAANNEEVGNTAAAEKEDEGDELFYDAGSLIITSGQASTSYLQRRLAIGNPRAARIMDLLETKGVVGGPNGSKPREILMSMPEFEEKYGCH